MTRNFSAWPIYALLGILSAPLAVMYLFLVIDTFTNDPPGSLIPNEFTFHHWRFLWDASVTGDVWAPTATTFLFATTMVVIVLTVSSTAGYAISRLNLPFRRVFVVAQLPDADGGAA